MGRREGAGSEERERIGLVLFSKDGRGKSDWLVEILRLFDFLNSSRSFQSYCLFKVLPTPVRVSLFFLFFFFFCLFFFFNLLF